MKHEDIKQLLPEVFRRTDSPGSVLHAILEIMELLHARAEQALDSLDATFNPRRAPEEFVPYIASWVDLEWTLEPAARKAGVPGKTRSLCTGSGYLRELAASAARLSHWRGTSVGLLRFLQTATGCERFSVQENETRDGRPRLFHIVVRGPDELRSHRALLERIIAHEKPAHVTCELALDLKPVTQEHKNN